MSDKHVPCRVAQLPPETWLEAARAAVRENPANAPPVPPWLAPVPPERIALLTSKFWGPRGVDLSVSFTDGPDAETRRKILLAANAWGATANVRFRETGGQGQVRIARTPGQGYYSYLGPDNLHIPAGQCTMNLDSFTAQTPDSEYSRVVKHEFGHVLGFDHEHKRTRIQGRIDPQKAIAYFARYDGWDEETVRQQVLTLLPEGGLTALPEDVLSIMCYGFPGEITRDGQPIPGGTDIDEEDFKLAEKLYPKSGTGGGNGGGGGGGPAPAPGKLFTLTFRQPVRAGGQVSFRARVAIPPGSYDVIPEGVAGHAEVEAEAT